MAAASVLILVLSRERTSHHEHELAPPGRPRHHRLRRFRRSDTSALPAHHTTAAEADALGERVLADARAEAETPQLERVLPVALAAASKIGGAVTNPINAHSGAAYRATKGVLGSSRASLLKIANNALYFSMGLTDADAGIPPENKYALVSRVGALPTSKKHRSLTGSVFLLEREPEVRPRAPAPAGGDAEREARLRQLAKVPSSDGIALERRGGGSYKKVKWTRGGAKGGSQQEVSEVFKHEACDAAEKSTTRCKLALIAYNALSLAQMFTDADDGIPAENKIALAARCASLTTNNHKRSISTVMKDPLLAGGLLLAGGIGGELTS